MRSVALGLAAAAALAGCSLGAKTVHHSGVIGQTLTGPGGLAVTPDKYRPLVPAPRTDVTGLATPAPGTHFASFLIHICITTSDLPTIASQNFGLELTDGSDAVLKFPEDVFSDDLDLLGESGCEQGHIVFQVPARGHPATLTFKLDIDRSDSQGNEDTTHVRLEWMV